MARPTAILPVKRQEYHINMALYGEPGVGKSVLAASGPKTLLLVNDKDEPSAAAELGSTAHTWLIEDIATLEEAYNYVRHEGYREYDWIWIDNLTLLQEQFMDQLMEQLVVEKPHRNRWVPDMHEYLVIQNQVSTYVRNFKAIPIHFGWTAHAMRAEDEEGAVLYTPMIQGGQGQLSQKLCGYMNVVAYMSALRREGTTERKIVVSKRGKFYAKSRWSGLQSDMRDPTIPKIMRAVASKFPALGEAPAAGKLPVAKKAGVSKKVATAKKTVATRKAS